MELLVAFDGDPAGSRMAARLAADMESDGPVRGDGDAKSAHDARISGFWRSRHYDMITISTPAISADWLEDTEVARAGGYDGYVFLSRHSAESGVLALTCHSTGNFGRAEFGGNDSEVALPHPHLQRAYLRKIHGEKEGGGRFGEFDITIEATHHGPSALGRPALFIEVGTTQEQWGDDALCGMVADAVHETISSGVDTSSPVAVCFGGTHYPQKFTDEILHGRRALGTVIPKRAMPQIDGALFRHILERNGMATEALLDWGGIPGSDKGRLMELLAESGLEVSRV